MPMVAKRCSPSVEISSTGDSERIVQDAISLGERYPMLAEIDLILSWIERSRHTASICTLYI